MNPKTAELVWQASYRLSQIQEVGLTASTQNRDADPLLHANRPQSYSICAERSNQTVYQDCMIIHLKVSAYTNFQIRDFLWE